MTFLCGNPRYMNYARVHGRTPAEQYEHDKKRWPGGSMLGFLFWNKERAREYSKINPGAFCFGSIVDQEAYDEWLDQYLVKEK